MAGWLTGSSLSTARYGPAGGGTESAAFAAGGNNGAQLASTEEWDGANWSAGGNLITARSLVSGCGSLTAGLAVGGDTGSVSSATEEYDGTSWSAGGSISPARHTTACFGPLTAAVTAGGHTTNAVTTTQEYDGTSWSSGGALPAARAFHSGCGTLTAGLVCGGILTNATYTAQSTSYEYDGTSWSSGGTLTAIRSAHGVSGTQTNALAISGAYYSGGAWNHITTTDTYDGTTWTAGSDVNTARRFISSAGDSTNGLCFGGITSGYYGTTEYLATNIYIQVDPLVSTFTLPAPTLTFPVFANPSPLIGTFALPAPTVVSSIKVLPDPLTGTFTIPDVIAGVGVVAVDPLIATFTIPAVTVSLPCIVTVSPLTSTFYILDPYVVASQKSILFGAYNFPCSKTMSYKIVDDTEVTIQDWTTTGVTETVVDATANKSIYTIRTNKVNENFQGKIMWKSSDATPLTAVEIINIYSSYVDILQNRVTSQRATNLDNLDRANSLSLAALDYTAPDNAGIASNGAAIAALPLLSEIEGSSILAKEATLAGLQMDTALLIAFIKNKRYLQKTGSSWYLVIRNANDSADILNKALKGPDGVTEITDIQAAALGMEMKTSV